MSLNFITNFISKISVSEFIAIVTFIGPIVYSIADYLYKITCEKRYSIEKNNFTFNNKFLLFMLSAVLLLLTSMILQLLSEYMLDDENFLMVMLTSSIILFLMAVALLTYYDIYMIKIKTNSIKWSNFIFGIFAGAIYILLFMFFIKGCDIFKIFINSNLDKINCIIYWTFIIMLVLNLTSMIISLKKKVLSKCIKFAFKTSLCIFFSISFFYLSILFPASNAAMKVNYDISKKLNNKNEQCNVDETGDKRSERMGDIVTNRVKEIRNFPLNIMSSYFNNPKKLYTDEFIDNYKAVYETDKVPNEFIFEIENDEKDDLIEYFKKNNILKEALRNVRVSYLMNIFDENNNSIMITTVGFLLYILSMATILWISLDEYISRVYEIIDEEYVVLSKTDDRYLVMNCEITSKDLKIYTGNYKIITIDNKNTIRTNKFEKVEISEVMNIEDNINKENKNAVIKNEENNNEENENDENNNEELDK